MIYIDKKYVNLVSGSLEKFKWKKDSLATCRCFKCGDSKRNKSKTRGYFFEHKGHYVYKCHNCGFSCNLYSVLENVSPSLCKEYAFEVFKEKNPEEQKPIREKKSTPIFTELGTRIDLLNADHKAVKYVESRKIPKEKYNNFYYTSDFGRIMQSFDREGQAEERLVIPFYSESGELLGVQGRSLGESAIRYITLKQEGCERLWYNIDKVDPHSTVYVTEGPIDSMFIPNGIAMQGAGWLDKLPTKIENSKVVFIFDNEPRNEEIVYLIGKYIEAGRSVVIWPEEINKKDINDMVIAYGHSQTIKLIINNVYSGLKAKMKYTYWKKV
jgi:DNA primase